ncbi:MAG TPA: hypothetical protein VE135_16185, partial [Pyrinomonadaceae bacterium]|nr:hypothetical protein [Pyrinomonadaceae bacterium]
DPLQAANAHLNFARLGVVADRYLVNFYGETTSFLHQAGTDRLWLTWLLNTERVKQRVDNNLKRELPSAQAESLPTVLRLGRNSSPMLSSKKPEGEKLLIEIPGKVNKLTRDDFELALRWREASRFAFTNAIDLGYRVEEFYRTDRDGEQIGVYLLATTHTR